MLVRASAAAGAAPPVTPVPAVGGARSRSARGSAGSTSAARNEEESGTPRPRRRGAGSGPRWSTPDDPAAQQPPGDPENAARIICLRLLDRRARSRRELADALHARGVPDDAAGRVLDRLTEVGLVDDAALAEAMAGAQHRERGLAREAVAVRLRKRGFDDDVVDAALESIDGDDERDRARALVAKRRRALAGLPAEVQTRRLVALLARKGYSAAVAYEVVRQAIAGADDLLGAPE